MQIYAICSEVNISHLGVSYCDRTDDGTSTGSMHSVL